MVLGHITIWHLVILLGDWYKANFLVSAAIAVGVTLPTEKEETVEIEVELMVLLTVELPIDNGLALLKDIDPPVENTSSGPLVLPVFSVRSVVPFAVLIVVTLNVLMIPIRRD